MAPLRSKKPTFIFGIKTKTIEDYIHFAEENDLRVLNINEHGIDIIIKREGIRKESPFRIIPAPLEEGTSKEQMQLKLTEQVKPSEEQSASSQEDIHRNYSQVKAPFVGTFYRRPSPDAEPFVKEGDMVNPGQTLCILEAMKVMNKINSEVKGKIVKIIIEDSKTVKKDDVLFLIEPQA